MLTYTGAIVNTLSGDNLNKATDLVYQVFEAVVSLFYTVASFMVAFLTQDAVLGVIAAIAVISALVVAGYKKLKSRAKIPGR